MASLGLTIIFLNRGITLIEAPDAGMLAGTASGLAYAFIIILARKISRFHSPYVISFILNLFIVILLLPTAFMGNYSISAVSLLLFLLMGLVHSTFALIIYLKGLREVKAQEAAVLGYLEPVGAILLALLILGEVPSATAAIGGLFIISAGYLVTVKTVRSS